ncbi:MAG TPA: serine hydrolase domain-containing protein, partial [Microbacterium sp.]|nr:serine hydrolase domain-containing protein [Microbacterium sp.]
MVDGEVLYEGALGEAAAVGSSPMTLDTMVSLGSTSKQFTGLAIQNLISAGRLALDDTVASVLPDVSGTAYDDVTVAQLLSHHSGISYSTGLMQWRMWLGETSVQDHARLMLSTEPTSTPGEAYEYSNGNFTVLGAMVEQITGDQYTAALDSLVLEPLGLTSTTADITDAQASGLAAWNYPWYGFGDAVTPQPAYPASAPSAFVNASARDLERLLLAHLGTIETAMPAEVLAAAREPLAPESGYSEHASGWCVRPFWELRDLDADWDDGTLPSLWEHQGTTLRSFSYLAMQPDLGFGVVILANTSTALNQGAVSALAYELVHEIAGTSASPVAVSPLIAAAPVLIVAVPLILIGVVVWLIRTARHPPRSRLSRAIPVAAAGLAVGFSLYLCFAVIPGETGAALFDHSWWAAVPDLAISTAIMLLLSLVAGGLLVVNILR